MYTPEQALAWVADRTPHGTTFIEKDYRKNVLPHEDSKPPTYFRGEYRLSHRFALCSHPPVQFEIYAPKGFSFSAYEVKPRAYTPTASIIGILMISMDGERQQPSLLFIDIESEEPAEPSHSLFLMPMDPNIYFEHIDPVDQLPGSNGESTGVLLTMQGITGLCMTNNAAIIFVSILDDRRGLDRYKYPPPEEG